jgi:hypothetical protein
MKRLTIYFTALFFTAFAFAGGDEEKKAEKTSQIKLQEVRNNVYQLVYPFENEQQVTIEIYDQEGKQLKKENIKNQDGFARMYDMSGLKEGKYTFKVKDAEGEISKALNLDRESQIAVIDRKGGKYQLLVDFSSRSDLYLNVYDENNNLVHHEKHENSKGFARTFDFAKLDGKKYKFEVRGYTDILTASTEK